MSPLSPSLAWPSAVNYLLKPESNRALSTDSLLSWCQDAPRWDKHGPSQTTPGLPAQPPHLPSVGTHLYTLVPVHGCSCVWGPFPLLPAWGMIILLQNQPKCGLCSLPRRAGHSSLASVGPPTVMALATLGCSHVPPAP